MVDELNCPGFESRQKRETSSAKRSDQVVGPPNCPLNGYRGLFPPRTKWAVREVGHIPAFTAEVKNEWSYISISLMPSWLVYELFFFYSCRRCAQIKFTESSFQNTGLAMIFLPLCKLAAGTVIPMTHMATVCFSMVNVLGYQIKIFK